MRPYGKTKLGFFPLPTAEAERLKNSLVFPPEFSALDPCVGDGMAFMHLLDGTHASRYGIEIDAYRAERARNLGIDTLQASSFDVRSPATACRAKEAAASPHRHVRRVRHGKHVGELGKDSPGRLGDAIRLGVHRTHLWDSRNPRMGGLVCGRTGYASCVDSRTWYWMRSGDCQRRERTVSRLAQLGRRKRAIRFPTHESTHDVNPVRPQTNRPIPASREFRRCERWKPTQIACPSLPTGSFLNWQKCFLRRTLPTCR